MHEISEQIRAAVDIGDLIGERVRLRRASRGYSGLCPFHEEHTPSFHVYEDTQSYYCFGCHEAGNIFTYVMKTEKVNFAEALKILADRAGITLPEYEHKSGKMSAYELLDLTARFYAERLKSSPGARAYLERRKLDASDIASFSLGYAHASWDALVRYLREQKVSDKQMLDLGLALMGKYGLYDNFRGRVIFPIKDILGRVVGLGGRLIDGEGAKYLNSPESEIYRKRKNLYLQNRAKGAIKEKKRTILVEGYMDAIRLHKNGFTESVASLGTSLTEEQAGILSRLADRCYICYDTDTAGQKATLRSMYALQKHGLDVYVINLPDGKDPDEYLTEHKPEEFEELIRVARPLVLQHIEMLRPLLSDAQTRKTAERELLGSLSELEARDVLEYKKELSEATGISPNRLEEKFLLKTRVELPEETDIIEEVEVEHPSEAALCALLARNAAYRIVMTPEEVMKLVTDRKAQRVALAILTENVEGLMYIWTSLGETEMMGVLERGDEYCAQMRGMRDEEKWTRTISRLKDRYRYERIKEIQQKMEKSEATAEDFSELIRLKGEK